MCSGPRSKYLGMITSALDLKASYGLSLVSLVSPYMENNQNGKNNKFSHILI